MTQQQLAFGDLEFELATTRRVLERLPEDKFGWKPHEKSFPMGKLAFHVVNLLFWQKISFTEPGFDLAASPPPENGATLPTKEELLKKFDENAEQLRGVLAQVTEENLGESWTLRHGDHEILTSTRNDILRRFGISHMIHHRAQLGLYLRLLDVPVPGMYGPSADER